MTESQESIGATLAASRIEMLARLATMLELVLDQPEAPPAGLDPEVVRAVEAAQERGRPAPGSDLHSLWRQLGALTQEVKLQGRAFKALTEQLRPLEDIGARIGRLESAMAESALRDQAATEVAARDRAAVEDASRLRGRRDALEMLFDVHERLRRIRERDRAHDTTSPEEPTTHLQAPAPHTPALQKAPAPFWRKWFQGSPVHSESVQPTPAARSAASTARDLAMRSSLELTIAALQDRIREQGAAPFGEVGERFDPATMSAIDISTSAEEVDGTVTHVHRLGYLVEGVLARPAEVTVARRANAKVSP